MSADIIDVLHRLTFMAHEPAQTLRAAISEAQTVLDKLDKFADEAQNAAQLMAASDLKPNYTALVPDGAGLVKEATK